MFELRLILLVAGVLFIAGIAGYEWWRSRGSRPQAQPPATREDPPLTRTTPASLPDINVVREPRVSVSDSLPVIELHRAGRSPQADPDGIALSAEVAVDRPQQEPTSTQAILRAHDEEPAFGPDGVSAARVVESFNVENAAAPHLRLEWPGEDERRIVTLRVMPQTEPRFTGRAVRQAFASAGFWHGPLDIYHLPAADGRVILSAAALAQPGTFDPSLMDSQRFSGLNLFAVLPGPLPERETFDELVHAARQLAERLDGRITDQHGEELTAQRVSRLRQSLEPESQARASGEG